MIKFIPVNDQRTVDPTFGDVKINQFFVASNGYLHQKIGGRYSSVIAAESGAPCAAYFDNWHATASIRKILPEIERIEF